jgi:hypothetical protein
LGCPVNFVGPVFVIGLLQKQKPNLKRTKSTTPRSLSIIRKQDKNYKNAPDDYEKQEITQRNHSQIRFPFFHLQLNYRKNNGSRDLTEGKSS